MLNKERGNYYAGILGLEFLFRLSFVGLFWYVVFFLIQTMTNIVVGPVFSMFIDFTSPKKQLN